MSDFTSGFWDLYIALHHAACRSSPARCCSGRRAQRKVAGRSATRPATSGTRTSTSTTTRCRAGGSGCSTSPSSSRSPTSCSIPGLGSWQGTLELDLRSAQYSSEENGRREQQYGPLYEKFAATDVETLATDPEARAIGQRLFLNYCAQCHASDARGRKRLSQPRPTATGSTAATPEDHQGDASRRPQRRHAADRRGARRARASKDVAHYVRSLSGPDRTTRCASRAARRCSRRTAPPATAPTARATRRSARPT